MIRIRVGCQGVSPILLNHLDPETFLRARSETAMPLPPLEEARKKLIIEHGRLGIPTEYLNAALVTAGRQVDLDAYRTVTSLQGTTLYRFLYVVESFLAFPESAVWVPDIRKGLDPKMGQKVRIVRARFDQWGFSCTLEVREDRIHPEKIRELFDIAGEEVGLGDFRPNGEERYVEIWEGKFKHRCPFGRFRVTEWEELSEHEVAQLAAQR